MSYASVYFLKILLNYFRLLRILLNIVFIIMSLRILLVLLEFLKARRGKLRGLKTFSFLGFCPCFLLEIGLGFLGYRNRLLRCKFVRFILKFVVVEFEFLCLRLPNNHQNYF